jgi:predicted HTH domain antitoxin
MTLLLRCHACDDALFTRNGARQIMLPLSLPSVSRHARLSQLRLPVRRVKYMMQRTIGNRKSTTVGHKMHFEWELPESLLGLIAQDEAKVAEEVKRAAVLEWVRMKKVSWRKGAELLGMTYRDFLSLMAEHKIPTLDYTGGWLEKELAAF